jgi:hypothetical protein
MQLQEDGADASSGRDEAFTGDPEAWGYWEAGLVLGSIAVGAMGFVVLGWAVERFIFP